MTANNLSLVARGFINRYSYTKDGQTVYLTKALEDNLKDNEDKTQQMYEDKENLPEGSYKQKKAEKNYISLKELHNHLVSAKEFMFREIESGKALDASKIVEED